MRITVLLAATALATALPSRSATAQSDAEDLAARLGARPAVEDAAVSPNGTRLAFAAPSKAPGRSRAQCRAQ